MTQQFTKSPRAIEAIDAGRMLIDNEHAKFLKKYDLSFRLLAHQGLPKPKGDSSLLYIVPIKKDYEAIIPKLESISQSKLQKQLGSIEMNEAREKAKELSINKDKAVSKLNDLQPQCQGQISFLVFVNLILFIICFSLACAGEIAFQSIAMQGIPGITPMSGFFLGVGVVIVTTVISILSKQWIQQLNVEIYRKLAHIGVGILLFMIFFAMAQLRDGFQQTMNNGSTTHFWSFILINFGLSFAIYLMITFWFAPIKDKVKELINKLIIKKEVNKLVKQINTYEEQLTSLKQNLTETLSKRLKAVHLNEQHQDLISRYYEQCVHTAIQANTEARNFTSDCFLDPIPVIQFPIQKEQNNYYENEN